MQFSDISEVEGDVLPVDLGGGGVWRAGELTGVIEGCEVMGVGDLVVVEVVVEGFHAMETIVRGGVVDSIDVF